jgi:hypothetical protein
MSNFDTLSNLTGGTPGLAPRVFSACTEDDQVAVTALGYVNDLGAQGVLKNTDVLHLNTGATDINVAVPGMYRVLFDGTDYSLIFVI